jgi:hypothetical protein
MVNLIINYSLDLFLLELYLQMHVVDMLKDLRTEYNNCKDDPERERSLRRPLIELLLIQVHTLPLFILMDSNLGE